MSATISFPGPYTYSVSRFAAGAGDDLSAPFTTLRIEDEEGNNVTLLFTGAAEAGALALAAVQAKDTFTGGAA